MTDNRVKEAPAVFNAGTPWPVAAETQANAGVYRAKVFKSGNSLALRLPKALGLVEGSEMVLRKVATGYVLEPVDAPRPKLDISGFWGKAKGLKVPERRDFDERPSTIAARLAKQSG